MSEEHTTAMKVRLLKIHLYADCSRARVEALDPEEELETLKPKVSELFTLYEEWKDELGIRCWRLPSLFIHCVCRIRRMMFRKKHEEFAAMAQRVMKIHAGMEGLYMMDFPKLIITEGSESNYSEKEEEEETLEEKLARLQLETENQRKLLALRKLEEEKKLLEEKLKERHKEEEEAGTKKKRKNNKKKKTKKSKIKTEKKKKKKNRSDSSEESSESDSSCSSSTSTSTTSSSDSKSSRKKNRGRSRNWSNPLAKWPIKYGKGEDLHSFLDDVEEAMDTHDVRDKDVIKGFSYLLTGPAKVWFRNRKQDISTWRQLKKEMTAAFSGDQDDDEIFEKISQLRQKSDENFSVFEARTEELFKRLKKPLDEDEKVRKLLKGIHLFYRSRIRSSEIKTIRALRRECRLIEEDKSQVLKLTREEQKRDGRKDEKGKTLRVSAIDTDSKSGDSVEACRDEPSVSAVSAAALNLNPIAIQCWRCGKTGHFAHQCPTKISCMGCGLADVIIERCPRCAVAYSRGIWGNPQLSWTGGSAGQITLPPMNVPPPMIPAQRPTTPQQQRSPNQPLGQNQQSSPRTPLVLQRSNKNLKPIRE